MVKPNKNEVKQYHDYVVSNMLKIIENVSGIQVAYADPFLADVSLYIDYESEPALAEKYSVEFAKFAKQEGVPEEECEYLDGMNFSVIALAFMLYQQ